MSAEPERPCPACAHGMARAEGPVAGAAHYLCRFCEVLVHVRPDGRETVSRRVGGERREFDLAGGRVLAFPLPGKDVTGAGHPVRVPGHPVAPPSHPVSVPEAPVDLPGHPTNLPGHPVARASHPVDLPSHAVRRPAHAVVRAAHPVSRPGHPVSLPGHPVRLPGHPVGRPGHPIGLGGRTVAITRVAPAAEPCPAPEPACEVVVPAAPESSRFFCARPNMPSVLR